MINNHKIRLYFRYFCRVVGCTKQDLMVLSMVALVFALAVICWTHSPTFYAEKADQRQHAIEFLKQHQGEMLPDDIDKALEAYGINRADIAPPKVLEDYLYGH